MTLSRFSSILAATALSASPVALELPALPEGLSSPSPELPTFGTIDTSDDPFTSWHWDGFVEARYGKRLQQDPNARQTSISETRMQLGLDYASTTVSARLSADVKADGVASNDDHIALDKGHGFIDLREAWIQLPAGQHLDIKAGRQILTWGVGDQLFINDMFPKDWNSFFIGRDQEYLKAPSDAIKLAFYFDTVNLDLVWSPEFDSDRYISGSRISFFDPLSNSLTGEHRPIHPTQEKGSELALRLHKTIDGIEYAAYGYQGFWKSPNSFDTATARPTFAKLQVIGASLRKPLAGGILSAEVGKYRSESDTDGSDPWIANGETRWLIGYEREVITNTTASFQWYLEQLDDYKSYKAALPANSRARDEIRQVMTARLTLLRMNQNLEWSLFAFFSPTDQDSFIQPKLSYKYSDHLTLTLGGNLFFGESEHTFFGQFENNTNIYTGLRYNF